MKQTKRPTRAEKKEKFKTINNWIRQKTEEKRKDEAKKLNEEFNVG